MENVLEDLICTILSCKLMQIAPNSSAHQSAKSCRQNLNLRFISKNLLWKILVNPVIFLIEY